GARRVANRADRGVLVGLFQRAVQGRGGVLHPGDRADLHTDRHPRPGGRREGMKSALRDAVLSALVALGLFVPMIGLKTNSGAHGLYLTFRPVPVAIAVAAVFVGRLLLLAWRARSRAAARHANRAFAERLTRAGKYVAPLLLIF